MHNVYAVSVSKKFKQLVMPKDGLLSSGKESNMVANICLARRVSVASLEIDQRIPNVLEDVKAHR